MWTFRNVHINFSDNYDKNINHLFANLFRFIFHGSFQVQDRRKVSNGCLEGDKDLSTQGMGANKILKDLKLCTSQKVIMYAYLRRMPKKSYIAKLIVVSPSLIFEMNSKLCCILLSFSGSFKHFRSSSLISRI